MTKEEAYQQASHQSLCESSTETRQDIIYRAMEIYSQSQNSSLIKEVERMNGLIEKAFRESYNNTYQKITVDKKWEQFRVENKL